MSESFPNDVQSSSNVNELLKKHYDHLLELATNYYPILINNVFEYLDDRITNRTDKFYLYNNRRLVYRGHSIKFLNYFKLNDKQKQDLKQIIIDKIKTKHHLNVIDFDFDIYMLNNKASIMIDINMQPFA